MTKEALWTKDFKRITFINLCIFMSFQMLIPTLPVYAKSLGAGDSAIGILIGSISLAAIAIRPFAGVSIDAFGRRRMFLPALAMIIVLTFSYGLAFGMGSLLILRFFHGLFWGVSSTAVTTMVSDVIPTKRFAEGIGYFALSTSVALAVAPAFALTLLDYYNFRLVTYIATVLIIIAFWQGLVYRDKGQTKPLVRGQRLQIFEPAAYRPAIMIFFVTASMGAVTGFVAVYAHQVGVQQIAPFFTIYAVCMVVTRPFIGRLVDRFGFRGMALASFFHMVLALYLLSIADKAIIFYFAGAAFGLGFGAAQSVFQTMAVIHAPENRIGAANATFFIGFDGGIAFGGLLSGALAQAYGYDRMYFIFTGVVLLAAILYRFLGWHIQRY